MLSHTSPSVYQLDIDGTVYELGFAEFIGVLFEIVMMLVFEKLADRVSYMLPAGESDLCGSRSTQFEPLCVGLYRHLKQVRCPGPEYPSLAGETQSFKLHSLKDGLVAAAFFLKAGDAVPHFTLGWGDRDVLVVLDRGARSRLTLEKPELLSKLTRLVTD
ncbi:MAG: hypothetical protein PVI01_07935 [Gemmatimonadales bacterium]|jgi:hypothetical protein